MLDRRTSDRFNPVMLKSIRTYCSGQTWVAMLVLGALMEGLGIYSWYGMERAGGADLPRECAKFAELFFSLFYIYLLIPAFSIISQMSSDCGQEGCDPRLNTACTEWKFLTGTLEAIAATWIAQMLLMAPLVVVIHRAIAWLEVVNYALWVVSIAVATLGCATLTCRSSHKKRGGIFALIFLLTLPVVFFSAICCGSCEKISIQKFYEHFAWAANGACVAGVVFSVALSALKNTMQEKAWLPRMACFVLGAAIMIIRYRLLHDFENVSNMCGAWMTMVCIFSAMGMVVERIELAHRQIVCLKNLPMPVKLCAVPWLSGAPCAYALALIAYLALIKSFGIKPSVTSFDCSIASSVVFASYFLFYAVLIAYGRKYTRISPFSLCVYVIVMTAVPAAFAHMTSCPWLAVHTPFFDIEGDNSCRMQLGVAMLFAAASFIMWMPLAWSGLKRLFLKNEIPDYK